MTVQQHVLDTQNENDSLRRRTLALTEKTYNRLIKHGKWSETADQLLNRLLDEREHREIPYGEKSF